MTSVRPGPGPVNLAVTRTEYPASTFGRVLPARGPQSRLTAGPFRHEQAKRKKFPKRVGAAAFAGRRSPGAVGSSRYAAGVRNLSSTAVSSAGRSTGSSWPASMIRTSASG